jgi:hypothetical protein
MANSTQRNRNNLSGHSRKRKSTAIKIPQLKNSFDQLERSVASIIKSTSNTKERVKKLQESWRKIFGRPVEAIAAEAYIQVMSRRKPYNKSRKQSGGAAALAGAPLDFQTRPGVDGVHGSFPPYVSSGLSFYNTINQEGMFKGCGTENITPNVPASLGSNQAGGAGGAPLSDAFFITTTRPVDSSVPPSIAQNLQTTFQGRPIGPPADPSQNPLKYV